MNKTVGAAAVVLIVHGATGFAADSVTIELISGYPPPNVSAERVTLEIQRISAAIGPKERPIDQYFDAVRGVLKSCGVAEDWQYISPDSAFVRLKIAMDGRSITLITDRYGLRPEGGRDMSTPLCDSPTQNKNDRHRAALDRILELSMERSRVKFGK